MTEEIEAALMAAGHQIAALQAQRDALRIEVDQLRTYADALNQRCIKDTPDAERYRWLRDNADGAWAICAWDDESAAGGYYRDARAHEIVDAAIDAARSKT